MCKTTKQKAYDSCRNILKYMSPTKIILWTFYKSLSLSTCSHLYLMVPVGEGKGLMRWAMLSGMLMVKGEICGWTAFTGDSGSLFSRLTLASAVNVILMFVLGNRNVHLRKRERPFKRCNCYGLNKHQHEPRNVICSQNKDSSFQNTRVECVWWKRGCLTFDNINSRENVLNP